MISHCEQFARVCFSSKGKQMQLRAILDPVVVRYEDWQDEERSDFRKHVGDYVRLYASLSLVITFTELETLGRHKAD